MHQLKITRASAVAMTLLTVGLSFTAACTDATDDLETSQDTSEIVLPPPTNLVATAYSSVGVRVTWDPTPGAAYYIIYRGTAPGNATAWTSVNGTAVSSNTHVPNSQYCYKVRNVSVTPQLSTFSPEVCLTTPAADVIAAPANLVATPLSSSRISLAWDAVANATSYRIYQGLTGGALAYSFSTAAPTTTAIVAGLTAATSYSFYVEAVTAVGVSPPSTTVSATTLVAGLEGNWKFEESSGTTTADQSGLGRTGTLSAAAFGTTNLPPIFRRSNRSVLDINASTASAVTVPAASGLRLAGSSFTATAWVNPSGDTLFMGMRGAGCDGNIGWVVGNNAVSGLYFQDATTTRASGVTVAPGVWSNIAVVADAATITFYINGVAVASQPYASVARPVLPFTIGHVGECPGAATLIDEVQVYSSPLSASQVAAQSVRPAAPTNVQAVNGCSKQQTISWDAVPGASLYYLFRGTASGNQTFATSVAGNRTSFSVGGLTPATQYSWYVLTDINNVYSVPSNEVILTTKSAPAAPASLTATAISNSRINITFPAVTDASRYFIYVGTAGGPLTYRTTVVAAGTVQIANLAANTNYTFAVRALDCSNSQSPDSPTASATTLP